MSKCVLDLCVLVLACGIHVTGYKMVSVDTCSNEQYGQCVRTNMKLSEFIHALEDQCSEAPASHGPMLYMKDWHICR